MKARLVSISQFLVVKKEIQQVGRTLEGGNERSNTPFLAFWSLFTPSPLRNQISAKKSLGEVLNFFLSEDHKTTLTFCQVIILLYTI